MTLHFAERSDRAHRECMDKLHDTIANLHNELADARFLIGKLKMQCQARRMATRGFVNAVNDGLLPGSDALKEECGHFAMLERDLLRWERWDREDGIA